MLLSREEFFIRVKGEYSVQRKHSVIEGTLNREAGGLALDMKYIFVRCLSSPLPTPKFSPEVTANLATFRRLERLSRPPAPPSVGGWCLAQTHSQGGKQLQDTGIQPNPPTSSHVTTEAVLLTVVKLASPVVLRTFCCSWKTNKNFRSLRKWYPGQEFESVSQ